jgi:hypothetical protein
MLVDGKFVKEEPPKIGVFYYPQYRDKKTTPEERLAQDILLGLRCQSESFLSKVFGLLLRV